jgi:hypothetical protein
VETINFDNNDGPAQPLIEETPFRSMDAYIDTIGF